ncbi:hypothetical protein Sps_00961 [Shewanella psychrophila]|uniref:Uncharacterized protein n=1 Tax=Shewanella psychrophila TaxID=225848 RepID=A0A1S6HKV6_9GAMM|nr:hypothetical protein Sps_00961 [Shewanella psychrophila]
MISFWQSVGFSARGASLYEALHYALFAVELVEKDIMLMDKDVLPHNWQEDPAPADTAG